MGDPQATITLEHAADFLRGVDGVDLTSLVILGAGAWSKGFGFTQNGADLVVRFGNHVEDFEKDLAAYRFQSPTLPIPKVIEVGRAYSGYYAISERVQGGPLEHANSAEWVALIPSLCDAFEAMRVADIPPTWGVGGWGGDAVASNQNWSEYLLGIVNSTGEHRIGNWREQIKDYPTAAEAFQWGASRLQQTASNDVPISLLHRDLINANAFAENGRLTGIFDWGCGAYGDHLYDFAWFEFWSPWYPELNMDLFWEGLRSRWSAAGYEPLNIHRRLNACYLHIGLDHLAYNALTRDEENLRLTRERMFAVLK